MEIETRNKDRSILIKGIIRRLNDHVSHENKRLCDLGLYSEQMPLHGADMFFRLTLMSDDELDEIATACDL